MTDDAQIAVKLDQIARELRSRPPAHWIDAFAAGDVVGSEAASAILDVSPITARRRAAESVIGKRPIAVCIGNTWLFSVSRLLDDVEHEGGRPARLAAMSRAQKYAHLIASDQKLASDARLRSA